jgi:hypothetical protein
MRQAGADRLPRFTPDANVKRDVKLKGCRHGQMLPPCEPLAPEHAPGRTGDMAPGLRGSSRVPSRVRASAVFLRGEMKVLRSLNSFLLNS